MLLDISPIESVHIFERAFSKEFANHRAPYAEISGDSAVIHNFRNFDYVTKTDFHPRWETKTVHLSNLRTVDYFQLLGINAYLPHLRKLRLRSGGLCLHFDRDADDQGPGLFGTRGLYRQFALYYVIGDQRDIVRLRTKYRLEDVYLYHLIPATPERARALSSITSRAPTSSTTELSGITSF